MLHYVKDNEKLQGCPRCLTEWCNKDPKSALETQVAVQALHSMQQEKGKAEIIRSHNYNFLKFEQIRCTRGCSSHRYHQVALSADVVTILNSKISGIQL